MFHLERVKDTGERGMMNGDEGKGRSMVLEAEREIGV